MLNMLNNQTFVVKSPESITMIAAQCQVPNLFMCTVIYLPSSWWMSTDIQVFWRRSLNNLTLQEHRMPGHWLKTGCILLLLERNHLTAKTADHTVSLWSLSPQLTFIKLVTGTVYYTNVLWKQENCFGSALDLQTRRDRLEDIFTKLTGFACWGPARTRYWGRSTMRQRTACHGNSCKTSEVQCVFVFMYTTNFTHFDCTASA